MLLDAGLNLTLRPIVYPSLFERYKSAIKNTWTVEEVDFSTDLADLKTRLSPGEGHLINRLVAFFATGDSIVANNLVISLYRHLNSPEARMYLSRQLFEEAQHIEFYLMLLDTYIPDHAARAEAFAAIDNIPSVRQKANFCFRWMELIQHTSQIRSAADRRKFLLNLICFASCVEGLFFFAAFAYVYFLRSKGLLHGLASGTNWVFRDESSHIAFAFEIIDIIRRENPELWDAKLEQRVQEMLSEAVECEVAFAEDVLGEGIAGLSLLDMRQYLEYVADQRLSALRMQPMFGARNPFGFLDLQDVQELTNFFERRVSAYQIGVAGVVTFDEAF